MPSKESDDLFKNTNLRIVITERKEVMLICNRLRMVSSLNTSKSNKLLQWDPYGRDTRYGITKSV